MILAFIICAVSLIVLGFLVKEKKCYNLIAGYNMMKEEEKATVDVVRLARRLAIMTYISASLLLIGGIATYVLQISDTNSIAILFAIILFGINILIIRGDGKNKVGAQNFIGLAVVDVICFIFMLYLNM